MIKALSRRLRVRDDGTGKAGEKDGTFAEFETEDAIILLGDPGMGKTTLFKELAGENYRTVRSFLIAPSVATSEPLFLDALDEYRTITGGQDASGEVAKALCSLKKPKFRLSCRAADWFGSVEQEALRTASTSGRIIILELCPLSREEILHAVQGIVSDSATFLNEAEAAGLGKLLENPQTLELVAKAWETDKKPQNKFEAYEIGVSKLLKETNQYHVGRGADNPDSNELRKASCAAASILLLSNSVGLARTEPAEGNGYVKLLAVPYLNKGDLDAVLRRRLFISSETDRFEPIHRTIVEFLAAEDLAQRIADGLPIERVMALICGVDGKPVSSLRGLFAWLVCRLGHIAAEYVERDPFGVVTYGDASVLPPNAQGAIWTSLRELRDPWFLMTEDDRGSFHNLANLNTAKIIREILQDPATRVHLKIAVLEAITNSTEDIGLNAILRDMALEKHDNTWLRSTALRAFAKSVQNDWTQLEALDCELTQATDDLAAPEVRVELLRLTPAFGSLALRMLSILEQVATGKEERSTFGRFYPLIALPSDTELDVILDDASRVLISESGDHFELQSLFDEWLKKRLESPTPITPVQLTSWLRNIRPSRVRHSETTLISLRVRFESEPSLFEEVFELLASDVPNEERSFWLFVAHDLWKLLPATVWSIPHCEFFLARAEKDNDPERAADLFRMYVSWLPERASVALAEAGFNLLNRRPEVEKILGDWNICKIEKWREEEWERQEEESRKHSEMRAQNIASLTPRLTTIREGREESALAKAAIVYLGFSSNTKEILDARERLVRLTNDEIADAFIEGFIRYVESPTIPKKEEIIASRLKSSIPYSHSLLSLSVFLRLTRGMTMSEETFPHCIAAAVTAFNARDKVPGHDQTLSKWILQEARKHPAIVKSVLTEIWLAFTTVREKSLPGFYDLIQDPDSQRFLVSLSAEVLKNGIKEDRDTVGKLVSVLLQHDQKTALVIGETELARNELSAEVRAIWNTALFIIDPSKYLEPWKVLMADPNAAHWEAIQVIRGSRRETREAVGITSAQRTEVISAVGRRFANVGPPDDGWTGDQNPWDASRFVVHQIELLAADSSPDVDAQLERLENDNDLASYRDLIRHQRAQHEKQQRESSFTFASPEHVAEAIRNRTPATPNDLLAFIVDHLGALAYDLTRTQRERYRAYWNEKGRNLDKPKREEVCSGLLAEDLQNRVQAQGLIVTVEHHMVADKECDLVVLQGIDRLLPIEVKHHYHAELWTAWHTQLDRLYTRDAKAGGLGIYLVLWSGEANDRKMPKLPAGFTRPASAAELKRALESLIPEGDQHRLRIVVVDISEP